MRKPLHLTNNHKRIEEVYKQSEVYLSKHDNLHNQIAIHLRAYHYIENLPPRPDKGIFSHFFFPYSESYYELENSFELCKLGFYRYSLFALRCVLELGLVGLYYDIDVKAQSSREKWILNGDRTPGFKKEVVKKLFILKNFHDFDSKFAIQKEIEETYDLLGASVHVRGFKRSSTWQNLANFNRFIDSSFNQYVDSMKKVVKGTITMILLKYPIGMQDLPLWAKFNGTPTGFLDANARQAVLAVLDVKTQKALRKISDNDSDVQKSMGDILAIPNRTEEDVEKEYMDLEQRMKKQAVRNKQQTNVDRNDSTHLSK